MLPIFLVKFMRRRGRLPTATEVEALGGSVYTSAVRDCILKNEVQIEEWESVSWECHGTDAVLKSLRAQNEALWSLLQLPSIHDLTSGAGASTKS